MAWSGFSVFSPIFPIYDRFTTQRVSAACQLRNMLLGYISIMPAQRTVFKQDMLLLHQLCHPPSPQLPPTLALLPLLTMPRSTSLSHLFYSVIVFNIFYFWSSTSNSTVKDYLRRPVTNSNDNLQIGNKYHFV